MTVSPGATHAGRDAEDERRLVRGRRHALVAPAVDAPEGDITAAGKVRRDAVVYGAEPASASERFQPAAPYTYMRKRKEAEEEESDALRALFAMRLKKLDDREVDFVCVREVVESLRLGPPRIESSRVTSCDSFGYRIHVAAAYVQRSHSWAELVPPPPQGLVFFIPLCRCPTSPILRLSGNSWYHQHLQQPEQRR